MRLCMRWPKRAGLAGVATLALAACSPALDWRDAGLAAPLLALLPCKPERAERAVPLLGPQAAPVTLRMASCTAGGATWALAEARLPDGAQAAAALAAWQRAAWATLGAPPAAAEAGALPPGWAEVPCAGRGAALQRCLRGPGRAPDGRAVRAELHWSARGPWLVQAAAYLSDGAALPAAAHEAFFGALAWRGPGS
ncbi:hypothetical protein Tsedi_01763 [Tepidimonas sediminis]|uniref:Uncharacterized protein n=2 Tax=Tepidimonas sediminis TaxID=2588941 RepID=A0A554WMV7_9BURK|nr:hypothetical protein Tsedi_01763 [Tepidimonas sediminis]